MKNLLPLVVIAAFPLLHLRAQDDRPVVDDRTVTKEQAATEKLPTLWLAGDSTMRSNAPMRGWAQDIGTLFDSTKINIVNRAIGGRSSRTFYTEGRWQEILDAIKPGDFVIIQFGHNDVGPPDARSKFRGSLKGIGDETETITKPDGSSEVVHTYGWYLKEMAASARKKNANVILCSPIPHKKFDLSGKPVPDWDGWRQWVASCAKLEQAAFVDLAELIGNEYDKLDQPTIEGFFADKGTHTNAAGSMFNAKAVLSGLRNIPTDPFAPYLKPATRSGAEHPVPEKL